MFDGRFSRGFPFFLPSWRIRNVRVRASNSFMKSYKISFVPGGSVGLGCVNRRDAKDAEVSQRDPFHGSKVGFYRKLLHQIHPHQCLLRIIHFQWIHQRPAHILKTNRHLVTILQLDVLAKTESTSSEIMYVQWPGNPMLFVFEVMMLKVRQAM